jgi:hypothetical protein
VLVTATAIHAAPVSPRDTDGKPTQERKSPGRGAKEANGDALPAAIADSVQPAATMPAIIPAIIPASIPASPTVVSSGTANALAEIPQLSPAAGSLAGLPLPADVAADAAQRSAAQANTSHAVPAAADTVSSPTLGSVATSLAGLPFRAQTAAGSVQKPVEQASPGVTSNSVASTSSAPAGAQGSFDQEAALRAALAATPGGLVVLNDRSGAVSMPVRLPAGVGNRPSAGPQKLGLGQPLAANDGPQHKVAGSNGLSSQDASSSDQVSAQDQGSGNAPLPNPVVDQTAQPDPSQVGVVAHAGTAMVDALAVPLASLHANAPGTAPEIRDAPSMESATAMQPEPAAMPLVSSAKLIQSIQQSDMRVGLNSSEFGAISIHTSTERGVLSSEITLGHAELARTITAHLGAAQQVPGLPQTFSVRVDAGAIAAGDSGGSAQQSASGRQQQETGRAAQPRSAESQPWAEQNLPIAARSHDGLNARLDIRI